MKVAIMQAAILSAKILDDLFTYSCSINDIAYVRQNLEVDTGRRNRLEVKICWSWLNLGTELTDCPHWNRTANNIVDNMPNYLRTLALWALILVMFSRFRCLNTRSSTLELMFASWALFVLSSCRSHLVNQGFQNNAPWFKIESH